MLSKNRQRQRLAEGWKRLAAVAAVLVMVPALTNVVFSRSAAAAVTRSHVPLPHAAPDKLVKSTRATPAKTAAKRKPYAKFDPAAHAARPKAGTVNVAVAKGAKVRAGSSPITLSGSGAAQIAVTTADSGRRQLLGRPDPDDVFGRRVDSDRL